MGNNGSRRVVQSDVWDGPVIGGPQGTAAAGGQYAVANGGQYTVAGGGYSTAGGQYAGAAVAGGLETGGGIVYTRTDGAYAVAEDACASCLCMEAAGPKVMTFVGDGGGDYIAEMSYKYVGRGEGDMTMVAPRRNIFARLGCCCCFLLLAVLALVMIILQMGPAATSTTVRPFTTPPPTPAPAATTPLPPPKPAPVTPAPKPAPVPCTTKMPYDCAAGYANWVLGWSESKKQWCCAHVGKGCTPAPTPPAPRGECTFWGDPHLKTFDGGVPSYYGDGEFWIVKSPKVHIQGRFKGTKYTDGLAATNRIAVGGPFMQGHTIIVGTMDDNVMTVDGKPVMTSFPGAYHIDDHATLKYDAYGELVDKDGKSAEWSKHVVHMHLPENVEVTVFRWANYLDLRIQMPAQTKQDGACGNFNGASSDDSTVSTMARIGARVFDGELLFNHRIPVAWTKVEQDLLDRCPKDQVEKAKTACLQELHGTEEQANQRKSCLLDQCYGANEHTLRMAQKLHLD